MSVLTFRPRSTTRGVLRAVISLDKVTLSSVSFACWILMVTVQRRTRLIDPRMWRHCSLPRHISGIINGARRKEKRERDVREEIIDTKNAVGLLGTCWISLSTVFNKCNEFLILGQWFDSLSVDIISFEYDEKLPSLLKLGMNKKGYCWVAQQLLLASVFFWTWTRFPQAKPNETQVATGGLNITSVPLHSLPGLVWVFVSLLNVHFLLNQCNKKKW